MWSADWDGANVVGGDGNLRLTPSFRLKEFRDANGGVRVHRELVSAVQLLRDRFGRPLSVKRTDADGLGVVVVVRRSRWSFARPPRRCASAACSRSVDDDRRRTARAHPGTGSAAGARARRGAGDGVLGDLGVRDRRGQVPADHRELRRRGTVVRSGAGELRIGDAGPALPEVPGRRRCRARAVLPGSGRLHRLAARARSAAGRPDPLGQQRHHRPRRPRRHRSVERLLPGSRPRAAASARSWSRPSCATTAARPRGRSRQLRELQAGHRHRPPALLLLALRPGRAAGQPRQGVGRDHSEGRGGASGRPVRAGRRSPSKNAAAGRRRSGRPTP